jgi:hypothetical protein
LGSQTRMFRQIDLGNTPLMQQLEELILSPLLTHAVCHLVPPEHYFTR